LGHLQAEKEWKENIKRNQLTCKKKKKGKVKKEEKRKGRKRRRNKYPLMSF